MNRMTIAAASLAVSIGVGMTSAACGRQSAPKEQAKPAAESKDQTKRYHLKGKIVAVKADAKALSIDGEDIPGFMGAMTMDYAVLSVDSIKGLAVGDEITADVVVPPDFKGAHLENIVVTKKAGA
jgi:protein SCO1/2